MFLILEPPTSAPTPRPGAPRLSFFSYCMSQGCHPGSPHSQCALIPRLAYGSPAPLPTAFMIRHRDPRMWDPDVPLCDLVPGEGGEQHPLHNSWGGSAWSVGGLARGPSGDRPLARVADCLPGGRGRRGHEPAVRARPCRAPGMRRPAVLGGDAGSAEPHDITGAVALPVRGSRQHRGGVTGSALTAPDATMPGAGEGEGQRPRPARSMAGAAPAPGVGSSW